MHYYWHLELYSGEIIKVKPENAPTIQEMIASQKGAITTPTRSIVVKDIKDFRLSDELYIDQKLIGEADRAFNQPTIVNGAVKALWVKKSVPQRRWDSFYKYNPSYHLLESSDSHVMIAFIVPAHNVNFDSVHALTKDDERKLSRLVK